MGQYRLWLQHRAIDQNLRVKHTMYTQELSEINEHIARLEQTAIPTNNALVTMLMQQIAHPEQTTTRTTEITEVVQPEQNNASQESVNRQTYPTPLPYTNGQSNTFISPAPPAPGYLPNFATQHIYSPAETPSADATLASPETTNYHLPDNLNTLPAQKPQENVLPPLPWWLRNLMQPTHEVQEPLQMLPIDQQSIHTNKRIEHWFARRTRLMHYDK